MNEIKIKIRPPTVNDGEQIADLFMKVWHTSLKDMVPDGFLNQFEYKKQREKYIKRAISPDWILLVAELDNNIVGMIGATNNASDPLFYEKQIRAMYIDPNFQRKGIGTKLLKSIFVELKNKGITSVMLWCIKANLVACSFYEKHGAVRIEHITPPDEYSVMPHVIYAWRSLQ